MYLSVMHLILIVVKQRYMAGVVVTCVEAQCCLMHLALVVMYNKFMKGVTATFVDAHRCTGAVKKPGAKNAPPAH